MDVLGQIIFLDKFFRDVGEFDASILGVGEMGFEVNYFMSKLENRVTGRDMMLLETSLTISREPVLVPTSPG